MRMVNYDERQGYNHKVIVGCTECSASISVYSSHDPNGWCSELERDTEQRAVKVWNHRPTRPRVEEAIQQHREVCFQGGVFAERGLGSSNYYIAAEENLRAAIALQDTSRVTRVELISHTKKNLGRVYVEYGVRASLSLQDEGRTLKIFVEDQ